MGIAELKKELSTHIRARYPVIAIETHEESRVIEIIADIAKDEHRTVYIYSGASGFRNVDHRMIDVTNTTWVQTNTDQNSTENDDTPTILTLFDAMEAVRSKKLTEQYKGADDKQVRTAGNIFIMLDTHGFMKDVPLVQRKLRDIVPVLKGQRKIIILVSPVVSIPVDLQKVISIIDVPLPDKSEIEAILCAAIKGLSDQEQTMKDNIKETSDPENAKSQKAMLTKLLAKKKTLNDQVNANKDAIVAAALGLTLEECENVFAKCLINGDLNIKTIISEKKQIIKKSGQLEYWEPEETSESIGGLNTLKAYIRSASKHFGKEAREYGIDPPRGIIMVGVPGSGKSLVAKACGNELRLPLLRLDMSQLVSKYYGESSNNMRNTWKLAKALAPCILWIDEIEKALGAGQNGEMHEESARLFGSFLTEMEESKGVFVVATCNDHASLKAELMSRFPKMFFVNAPTRKERIEIFRIHIKAVKRNPEDFDLEKLADASEGFVGREIRNTIQDALGNAFDEGAKPLTTDHIVKAMKDVTPITTQKKDILDAMIRWAEENAINASDDEEARKKIVSSKEKIGTRASTIDVVTENDVKDEISKADLGDID